jgi:hypothetical protein
MEHTVDGKPDVYPGLAAAACAKRLQPSLEQFVARENRNLIRSGQWRSLE